jgi:hypothetical protein
MRFRRFCNTLVLCATYLNDRLQCLIDRGNLLDLLGSTIDFLEMLASISRACSHNCSILKNFRLTLVQSSVWYDAGLTMANATVDRDAGHEQTLDGMSAVTVV